MSIAPIIPLALLGVEPLTTRAFLVCEGECKRPTLHRYKNVTLPPAPFITSPPLPKVLHLHSPSTCVVGADGQMVCSVTNHPIEIDDRAQPVQDVAIFIYGCTLCDARRVWGTEGI